MEESTTKNTKPEPKGHKGIPPWLDFFLGLTPLPPPPQPRHDLAIKWISTSLLSVGITGILWAAPFIPRFLWPSRTDHLPNAINWAVALAASCALFLEGHGVRKLRSWSIPLGAMLLVAPVAAFVWFSYEATTRAGVFIGHPELIRGVLRDFPWIRFITYSASEQYLYASLTFLIYVAMITPVTACLFRRRCWFTGSFRTERSDRPAVKDRRPLWLSYLSPIVFLWLCGYIALGPYFRTFSNGPTGAMKSALQCSLDDYARKHDLVYPGDLETTQPCNPFSEWRVNPFSKERSPKVVPWSGGAPGDLSYWLSPNRTAACVAIHLERPWDGTYRDGLAVILVDSNKFKTGTTWWHLNDEEWRSAPYECLKRTLGADAPYPFPRMEMARKNMGHIWM